MADAADAFVPPPEAPVFEPTAEEFEDPIAYITKIRPIGQNVGICKVRPPPDWQPPFVVDVENFKFTPRMQKINELEATTRVKLNFLDKLLKFWELQGTSIKIPTVDRKLLDFHLLHKTVQAEGGYDTVVRERKWSKVSFKMNLNDAAAGKCNGSVLRGHYEKYLYPYDLFEAGITVDQNALKEEIKHEEECDKSVGNTTTRNDCSSPAMSMSSEASAPSLSTSPAQRGRKRKEDKFVKTYAKSPKKDNKQVPDIDYTANSELKKLQFFGAGPKTVVPLQISKDKSDSTTPAAAATAVKQEVEPQMSDPPADASANETMKERKERKWKMRDRTLNWRTNYMEDFVCIQCERNNNEQQVLVCDACDDAYHMYCLVPPLTDMPKGDWRCPKCVARECNKPKAVYGFEQAKREFSLQEFGEMADQFKTDYFQMPVHTVPCETVEKEFWRLTTCLEEDVTVNYGADIHALTMGSGFPTKNTKDLLPEDEKYVTSSWNLNNLPVHEKSILKYVTGDVSGMKVPWCYVGMCFSSFCWHIEDHWSYSVNYHHWGEPKTWYGVPSSHGQQLEDAMKSRAPELFEQSPDLLHHITTIMNPNLLMAQGIPIVRTDQCAGEFIITFPRAFHAGFNQGYNFAEAVNFCPADWLPFGRECISHYKLVKRLPVFSHEELICKMAADPDSMDLQLAAQTHQELLAIVDYERKHRRKLLEIGVHQAEREPFELIPDDERQCVYCKTTCFLSAITCSCKSDGVACVEHAEHLCSCPGANKCLRYRYTLEEMPQMVKQLKKRAEFYDSWSRKAKAALAATAQDRCTIEEMKKLIQEAREKKYPDTSLMKSMQKAVNEAEKYASIATQLVNKNLRQPLQTTTNLGDKRTRLSLNELEMFLNHINLLPCVIKESVLIVNFLDKIKEFQAEAQACLSDEIPPTDKLEKLYQFGCTLDLDLVVTPKLKQLLAQAHWLDEVRRMLETSGNSLTLDSIHSLMERATCLAPHPMVEKSLAQLQELISTGEKWEEKAKICLQARPRHVINTIEVIISEARCIPAHLPNVLKLKEALTEAKEWISNVETMQMSEHYPYIDVLEDLVNRGRPIPVRLEMLPTIESQVTAAKSWRERTARTFLKKNVTYSLLEVLSPRADIGAYPAAKKRKKKDSAELIPTTLENPEKQFADPAQMVESFKRLEGIEMESMRAMRIKNMEKHREEDSSEQRFCLCRKGASGLMIQCELCKDWFHSHCVAICKSTLIKVKAGQMVLQNGKDGRFFCQLCNRSRRPRLETILSLLVSLQKLSVRLAEGEALQCLTERAMAWQDKARQALATDELTSALNKLTQQNQRISELAAREKTEKIINDELQKAASNPDLQIAGSFTHTNGSLLTNTQQLTPVKSEPFDVEANASSATCIVTVPKKPALVELSSSVDISEHAYSTVSKNSQPKTGGSISNSSVSSTESPRKHSRKSPMIPRSERALSDASSTKPPLLELSDMAKAQLDELMMEGDLLEVALDETQHIWKILQACSNKTGDDRIMEFEDKELEFVKPVIKMKKEKKKRMKVELSPPRPPPPPPPPPPAPEVVPTTVTPLKRQKKESFKLKDSREMKLKLKLPVPGAELKRGPPPKVKKVKRKKLKASKPQKNVSVDKIAGTVEEDEECSVAKCLKPSGEEVHWVQCDKCELWSHLVCLGLSQRDVSADDDFVCNSCRGPAMDLAAGDQASRAFIGDNEEIISVVSTPVPSASQSPMLEDSSGGEAGDGPTITLKSAHHDMEDGIELTSEIIRPDECSVDVDIEGEDKPTNSDTDSASSS
ncbi:lysine-specific demethylase 5A-like [Watersipora subatra]|uniref:lysine-specific demethylase 5A-like n=1 Tax=Watersipora subatra TaxID=2589382 RepID=UPI00355B7521